MPKSNQSKGFTLIELLVAISIISILSVIGFVSFQNIRSNALVAQRTANIDAIKKAYEAKFDPSANNGQGGYKAIATTDFANGVIPKAPDGASYILAPSSTNPDGSVPNFVACVNKTDGSSCPAQSNICYCKASTQGTPISIPQNSLTCDQSGSLIPGLVGFWDLEEGGSSLTTADSVGGQTGALAATGVTWTTAASDRINNSTTALNFNGSNSVTINDSPNLNPNSITISFWAKANIIITGSPQYQRIIGKVGPYEIVLFQGYSSTFAGSLQFKIKAGTLDIANTPAGSFPSGQWNHIVATFDSATGVGNIYINTTKYAGGPPSPGTLGSAPNTLRFGYSGFNGMLDKIRIYNKAVDTIDTTIINTLNNQGKGC